MAIPYDMIMIDITGIDWPRVMEVVPFYLDQRPKAKFVFAEEQNISYEINNRISQRVKRKLSRHK